MFKIMPDRVMNEQISKECMQLAVSSLDIFYTLVIDFDSFLSLFYAVSLEDLVLIKNML
jgi:hypothetical protein